MKRTFSLIAILTYVSFSTVSAQSGDRPFTERQEQCISQSVVQLLVETAEGYSQKASGVIVNDEGIIFTNAHVVENALEIQVWIFDSAGLPPVFTYFAAPQLISDTLDFAILEIVADTQGNSIDKSNMQLPCFLSWNTSPLAPYAPVYIVAYPNIGGGPLTITSGIVSTEVHQSGLDGQNIKLYGTDAIFATGASGGLVINNRGEFIGIPFEFRGDGPSTAQLTYFIPLSTICETEPEVCNYWTESIETSQIHYQLPCEVLGNWTAPFCWSASYVWVAPDTTAELWIENDQLSIQGPNAFALTYVEGYPYRYWSDAVIAVQYETSAPPNSLVLILCENEENGACSTGGSIGFTAAGELIIDPPGYGN